MLVFIARRLLYSIPVLLVSTFLSFIFVSLAGDPVAKVRGNPRLPASTVQNIVVENHLDRSIPVRYGYWIADVVTHKLGRSD
jgi:peptide/nickel transport system permease protein